MPVKLVHGKPELIERSIIVNHVISCFLPLPVIGLVLYDRTDLCKCSRISRLNTRYSNRFIRIYN